MDERTARWISIDGKDEWLIAPELDVKEMLLGRKPPQTVMKLVLSSGSSAILTFTSMENRQHFADFVLRCKARHLVSSTQHTDGPTLSRSAPATSEERKPVIDAGRQDPIKVENQSATAQKGLKAENGSAAEETKPLLIESAVASRLGLGNDVGSRPEGPPVFIQRSVELRQLYTALVESGVITEEEFVSANTDTENAFNVSLEAQQLGSTSVYDVLSQVVDPVTHTVRPLTEQLMSDIFRQVPLFAKIYRARVQNESDEFVFWDAVLRQILFFSGGVIDVDLLDGEEEDEGQRPKRKPRLEEDLHQVEIDLTLPVAGYGTHRPTEGSGEGASRSLTSDPLLRLAHDFNVGAEKVVGPTHGASGVESSSLANRIILQDLEASVDQVGPKSTKRRPLIVPRSTSEHASNSHRPDVRGEAAVPREAIGAAFDAALAAVQKGFILGQHANTSPHQGKQDSIPVRAEGDHSLHPPGSPALEPLRQWQGGSSTRTLVALVKQYWQSGNRRRRVEISERIATATKSLLLHSTLDPDLAECLKRVDVAAAQDRAQLTLVLARGQH
jgi:hypothetical protein